MTGKPWLRQKGVHHTAAEIIWTTQKTSESLIWKKVERALGREQRDQGGEAGLRVLILGHFCGDAHLLLMLEEGLGPSRKCPPPALRYLDEEAVTDGADLHGVGVRLPDVLLHLQDGPAVQGELPFLLQGHNRKRHLLRNWHTWPSSHPVSLLPWPEAQKRGEGHTPHAAQAFTNPSQQASTPASCRASSGENLGKT